MVRPTVENWATLTPKIDIQVEDALGRSWQTATIQVDLTMLPERFDLSYIDEHGQPQRPMAIHRAIYGSLERFIGILVEHFAGAFPFWLAPVQAVVIPIADRHVDYCHKVADEMKAEGLRVEVDARGERMQAKIARTFVEVESGKINERPELEKALHLAKVTGATLVIAKLDRLSRNAASTSSSSSDCNVISPIHPNASDSLIRSQAFSKSSLFIPML